ncbi:MAG TPA: putative colanic acid biosynthesis acetyltransferase [Methylocella sp.]|nr:putative colanic acid biosynthesis acetyltransferase [Methylocella sp.]
MSVLDAKRARPLEGGPTYPLRHRLFRLCWDVTWFLLAAWTPPPLRGWRRFLLRLFGAKVAPTAIIYGDARIWYPPNLEMKDHSMLARRTFAYTADRITIGEYAVVSMGAFLCTASHDIEDPYFQTIVRPITIGQRAWIAAEAFLGPGVNVGEGAVLGARGCAFRNLEAWTVYAGNPARELKGRKLRVLEEEAGKVDWPGPSASSPGVS